MCFSHAEILESMIEDVEYLSANCAAKVQPTFADEMDNFDEEDSYMNDLLDRWGDRKVPHGKDSYLTTNSTHKALILEANKLLAA